MWTPDRISRPSVSRTPSIQSMARSTISSPVSSYGGSIGERDLTAKADIWQPSKVEPAVHSVEIERPLSISSETAVHRHEEAPPKLDEAPRRRESTSSDHSQSTLASEAAAPEDDDDPKTPTGIGNTRQQTRHANNHERPVPQRVSMAGDGAVARPLERDLLSLLSKVCRIEREQPTIMAEDHARLQARVAELEAEKTTWSARHEALFALRDEDVANLIKIRGLLADERREHECVRKLRDDDLQNLVEVRGKLAQATWAKPAERIPPARTPVARQSRVEGRDLWQAAKTAAMEQKVLELEKANEALRAQSTSHPAPTEDNSWVEAVFEDSMRYREKMAAKVQQLRSEKEAMQKELARLEDRNEELEVATERLRRKALS